MKRFRKAASILLALVIILGTVSPVMATGSDEEESSQEKTYTLTIKNTGDTAHTFELYQIFTGDVVTGEGNERKLTNIKWGASVNKEGDATETAEGIEDANAFIKSIKDNLTDPIETSGEVAAGNSHEFTDLPSGYYMVKDVEDSQVEGGVYTTYIVKVVQDATAETKLDKPTVDKKVKDINDSTDAEAGDWQKSADHDIGDEVEFKLTGTLPKKSVLEGYDKYQYKFHDTMSKGLTLDPTSFVVKIGNEPVNKVEDGTSGYKLVVKESEDGETNFSIEFEDIKATANGLGVELGEDTATEVTVEYTAELNTDAVIGNSGNPNKVYLEYSNNPNNGGEGTNDTPEKKVVVFTYKLVVNKTDGEKELSGATFKLEKKVLKTQEELDAEQVPEEEQEKYKYIEIGTVEEKPDTTFSFKGLDDGTYILTELEAPEGYNKIEPIEFTISATHDEEEIKTLEIGDFSGNPITGDLGTGTLSTDVENKQGPELPETGGRGTKMLYIVGGLLVIGAVVYYFVEKKSLKNNQ